MPIYMDTHEGTHDLPGELREKVSKRIKSGEKDDFGVIDRGIIIDTEGNKMHCILDAPDAEAVMRHHQALDVPIARETVHRAEAILR